jgi:hypothetical protein
VQGDYKLIPTLTFSLVHKRSGQSLFPVRHKEETEAQADSALGPDCGAQRRHRRITENKNE